MAPSDDGTASGHRQRIVGCFGTALDVDQRLCGLGCHSTPSWTTSHGRSGPRLLCVSAAEGTANCSSAAARAPRDGELVGWRAAQ